MSGPLLLTPSIVRIQEAPARVVTRAPVVARIPEAARAAALLLEPCARARVAAPEHRVEEPARAAALLLEPCACPARRVAAPEEPAEEPAALLRRVVAGEGVVVVMV